MTDAGTISHASISENVQCINLYVYQFWCFYHKVNSWFSMPDYAAALNETEIVTMRSMSWQILIGY